MAVDFGERRVGVAVSDELGLLAHPRPALVVRSLAEAVRRVCEEVEREQAEELFVGLPLSLSGAHSEQTKRVLAFARALRERLPIPVHEVDERLTTVEAERRGVKDRRDGRLDSAAAALLLQSVLDARRGAAGAG